MSGGSVVRVQQGLPVTEQEAAAAIAAVHDMLGPDQEVVSVEKNVCIREEEVLLVNGTPITLEGDEGQAIKDCLLKGTIPNQDLINHLLMKAGLLVKPIKVQTELNVKSSTTHSENVYLHKNGAILDENCREKKEYNEYSSKVEEQWHPVHENLTEAGKSLRDRLKSTDSVHVNEKLDSLSLQKVSSQESLDQSFESEPGSNYTKNNDNHSVFNKSFDGSSASINSDRSGGSKSPNLLYNKENVIISGTLEELIHELVPRAHACPPDSFQFSFLLSSRLYLTPSQLLAEVCRRADQLAHMMSASSHPLFVMNLVRMLSNWMTWFPYDFQEEAVMSKMRKLSQLCVARDPSVQTRLTQLLQSLLKHLTAVDKHRQYICKIRKIQREAENLTPVDLTSFAPSPCLVAQQLTHIELQYLSFIGPDEFVNAFARDFGTNTDDQSLLPSNLYNGDSDAMLRAGKKTVNLESYVSWFNRLSYLIATSVCNYKKKKHRVRTIEFWIEVARECVDIGNFNSMMGIISGLNMNPVSRLKRTWLKIQSGKFDVLGHQMDPTSNFVSYRTTLQAAVSRSENATDKKQRVVIPFFSLLIKDLYFVNEGCASKLSNGHINMEKARTLAEHISQFMKWKDMDCPYEKNSRILDYFERSSTFSSNYLEYESFELEHPDSQPEKDQFKELKVNMKKA